MIFEIFLFFFCANSLYLSNNDYIAILASAEYFYVHLA